MRGQGQVRQGRGKGGQDLPLSETEPLGQALVEPREQQHRRLGGFTPQDQVQALHRTAHMGGEGRSQDDQRPRSFAEIQGQGQALQAEGLEEQCVEVAIIEAEGVTRFCIVESNRHAMRVQLPARSTALLSLDGEGANLCEEAFQHGNISRITA